MADPIRPTVDHQYWFNLSKEMVQSAASSRNDAATKLQNAVVWLWSIYTASAAIGIALSTKAFSLPVTLLIASPSAVLIAAYWVALWVQMPIDVHFDPREPADIKRAYMEGVNVKHRKLKVAVALSLASAFFVAAALFAASMSKGEIAANLQASLYTRDQKDRIAVSGHFPKDTKVLIRVTPIGIPANARTTNEFIYITTSSGELQQNIGVSGDATKYSVSAEWQEKDGLVRSLTRMISR
jgi:hypothetical protein